MSQNGNNNNNDDDDDVFIEDDIDIDPSSIKSSNKIKYLFNKNIFLDYHLLIYSLILFVLLIGFNIRRKLFSIKQNKTTSSSIDSIDRYDQMNKIRLEQQKRYDQQMKKRQIDIEQKKSLILNENLSKMNSNDSNDFNSNTNENKRLRTTNNFDDHSSCSYRPQSRRSNTKRG